MTVAHRLKGGRKSLPEKRLPRQVVLARAGLWLAIPCNCRSLNLKPYRELGNETLFATSILASFAGAEDFAQKSLSEEGLQL